MRDAARFLTSTDTDALVEDAMASSQAPASMPQHGEARGAACAYVCVPCGVASCSSSSTSAVRVRGPRDAAAMPCTRLSVVCAVALGSPAVDSRSVGEALKTSSATPMPAITATLAVRKSHKNMPQAALPSPAVDVLVSVGLESLKKSKQVNTAGTSSRLPTKALQRLTDVKGTRRDDVRSAAVKASRAPLTHPAVQHGAGRKPQKMEVAVDSENNALMLENRDAAQARARYLSNGFHQKRKPDAVSSKVALLQRAAGNSKKIAVRKGTTLEKLLGEGILSKAQAYRMAKQYKDIVTQTEWKRENFVFFTGVFGCQPAAYGKVVERVPFLLSRDLTARLQEFCDVCMKQLNLPPSDVGKVLMAYPTLLCLSADRLESKIHFFLELGVPPERLAALVVRHPFILACSISKSLQPKVTYLKSELGMSEKQILALCQSSPFVFGLNIEANLEPRRKFFEEVLGLTKAQSVRAFARQPALMSLSLATLQERVGNWRSLGFSTRDVALLISKNPSALAVSWETNVLPKLSFFRDDAKLVNEHDMVAFVLKYPSLLNYSIQKRLMPRWKFLLSLGLRKRVTMNALCFPNDLDFCKKYAGTSLARYVRFQARSCEAEDASTTPLS